MSTKPWTEAHRREALRRTCEIAAETAARLPAPVMGEACSALTWCAGINSAMEQSWKLALGRGGLDAARIEREVRRVRGLAEGRLVRETLWRVYKDNRCIEAHWMGPEPHHRARVASGGGKIVRVTRIRRAP